MPDSSHIVSLVESMDATSVDSQRHERLTHLVRINLRSVDSTCDHRIN